MADLSEEYRTAAATAGWRVDRRRGRLRAAGRDATAFLHALVTADVASVVPGGGVYAAYLTPQGRMITDLALYRLDEGWLIDVPSEVAPALLAKLDGLIFAEDVRLSDETGTTAVLSFVGGLSGEVVAALVGGDAARIAALPLRGTIAIDGRLVARTDAATVPTLDLFCSVDDLPTLTGRLVDLGAREISIDAAEMFRIEAGRPAFGVDMTTETIPLEAGLLDRAISLSKGCYVGQEVIVRVLHRGGGRVAKRLMTIEAVGDVPLVPGAPIVVGDREVGGLTSAAFVPAVKAERAGPTRARGRSIALGYVHRDFAVAGQQIGVRLASGDVDAQVVGAAG
jgi:folate-binding protein YgfZ